MENKPFNTFRKRPKNKAAWWVMGLGLSAIVILPVMGIFASLMRRLIDPASVNPNRSIIGGAGISGAVLSLLLSITTLITGFTAIQKGERSWVVWIGFVLALLVGVFWIFMIIGQLVYPH